MLSANLRKFLRDYVHLRESMPVCGNMHESIQVCLSLRKFVGICVYCLNERKSTQVYANLREILTFTTFLILLPFLKFPSSIKSA